MKIIYPQIGICGLSCRLCPNYQTDAASRCQGCKSLDRMALGCPFITCAVKKKELEFCWDCKESASCIKWLAHREHGKHHDSFKCYQTLENDVGYILENGVEAFEQAQKAKEMLLLDMLQEFNDSRSKSYYCIAATVMEEGELRNALVTARELSGGLDIKAKAKMLHGILNDIAVEKGYLLKLRKK